MDVHWLRSDSKKLHSDDNPLKVQVQVISTACDRFQKVLDVHGFTCVGPASRSKEETGDEHSILYHLTSKGKFDGHFGEPDNGAKVFQFWSNDSNDQSAFRSRMKRGTLLEQMS